MFLPNPKIIQALFIALWVALIIGGLLFQRYASSAVKRKYQIPMAVIGGLFFLCFVAWKGGRSAFLFAALPVLAIMFLNGKTVRYCPKCGAMNRNPYFYPLPKFCRKCGTALDESEGIR
jgi:hypothetical protein